ncbi:hypothetical protein LCGC14_2003220 [marine sediment metagenome]|uniref:HNH domain-containing protein n=1 Tax=marine sediment metagenome TaxID=412755 RepID=A0A0F9FQB9_9ZZZZ
MGEGRSEVKKISDAVLDGLVRTLVRELSGGYCKRCKRHARGQGEVSHLYRRRRKTVRWDLRNVHYLCLECHQEIDNDQIRLVSFMYDVLPRDDIEDLQRLANMTLKEYPIDRRALKKELQEKIRTLEE